MPWHWIDFIKFEHQSIYYIESKHFVTVMMIGKNAMVLITDFICLGISIHDWFIKIHTDADRACLL